MSPWLGVKALHVLLGIFWLGGTATIALFVLPALRALGPAGGPFMKQLTGAQRLHEAFATASIVTVATGVVLLARLPGRDDPAVWASPNRLALLAGMICGLAGLLWGLLVQKRRALELAALTANPAGPPTPEQTAAIAAAQRRLGQSGMVVLLLLVLAAIGMALSHPI